MRGVSRASAASSVHASICGSVRGRTHRVEVVVEPDRVEAELVGAAPVRGERVERATPSWGVWMPKCMARCRV